MTKIKTNPLIALMKGANLIGAEAKNILNNMFRSDKSTHIDDLQFRLDSVASKATYKGNRKPIGSTLPYKNKVKQIAINEVKSVEVQFHGDIMADGRHRYYVKDGISVERTSSI